MPRTISISVPSLLRLRSKRGASSLRSQRSSQLMGSSQGLFLSDMKVGPPSRLSGQFLFSNWSISLRAFLSFRARGYFSSRLSISSQIQRGSSLFSPKGTQPHMNQNMLIPREQRLTVQVQPLPMMISGAMQWGVPMRVQVLAVMMLRPLTTFAATRSISFRQPCVSTMKFSGLRSRMITPWVLRYSSTRMTEAMQNWVSSVLRMPISLMAQQSSSPCTNSTSEQRQCSSLKLLQYSMMKGWQRLRSRFFSWVMYLNSECSSIFCLLQHLSTQSFCFSCSLVQPTSRMGPNSPSFSSWSTTSCCRLSIILLRRLICSWNFSVCLRSFSSTTVSRKPPMISLTMSVLISAMTPSDSITMSSSQRVLVLFSSRNSSPYIWERTAIGLMFLYFFNAPSITIISFWLLTFQVFFFMTTLPDLQLFIFIRSRIFSICSLLSLERCVLFSIAHFMKLRKVTTNIWSPSTLLSVSRPRIRQVMSSSALTVICLTVLQKSACSPKESVFSSLVMSLLPLQTAAVPSLMMQKEEPGSPSLTITCPLTYSWVMRAPAMVSLWSLLRLLKNRTFSMNFLFYSYSWMMISSTALRKVLRSIAHRQQCSQAFTEKARGDLQRRAISPKPSPTLRVFLILSLEMTCIMPFSMMKKHMALLFYVKTKVSDCTEQQNIFLATFSIYASLRLQKMKWFLRQPSRKVISWYFFSFFSCLNTSSNSSSFTTSSQSLSQNEPECTYSSSIESIRSLSVSIPHLLIFLNNAQQIQKGHRYTPALDGPVRPHPRSGGSVSGGGGAMGPQLQHHHRQLLGRRRLRAGPLPHRGGQQHGASGAQAANDGLLQPDHLLLRFLLSDRLAVSDSPLQLHHQRRLLHPQQFLRAVRGSPQRHPLSPHPERDHSCSLQSKQLLLPDHRQRQLCARGSHRHIGDHSGGAVGGGDRQRHHIVSHL